MVSRDYGVTFGTVRMVLCALVFLGVCASICSSASNLGFMDYLQHEKLTWASKNPYHPKWEQMLNTVNLKTQRKNALYGVQSVKTALAKDGGTHYDLVFWPITDRKELPTCHTQFYIPLFGRHRDMTVKFYTCEPVTRHQDTIADLTHLNLKKDDGLLALANLG